MTTVTVELSTPGTKLKNRKLAQWVEEIAQLCKPDNVVVCDGSHEEYQEMLRLMIQSGTAIPLNPAKRPNSVLIRSNPLEIELCEPIPVSLER